MASVTNSSELDPLNCSLFIITALSLAGIAQTLWFKSPVSTRFAIPIDAGKTFLGRPLFGCNKTLRGFVVMVPAAGTAFFLLSQLSPLLPAWLGTGTWNLSSGGYALLGLSAGVGFMLGELPNSFLKRRLEIPPGGTAQSGLTKSLTFLFDRVDSIVGMLMIMSIAVTISWQIWVIVLVLGSAIHLCFSLVLFLLGAKDQPL